MSLTLGVSRIVRDLRTVKQIGLCRTARNLGLVRETDIYSMSGEELDAWDGRHDLTLDEALTLKCWMPSVCVTLCNLAVIRHLAILGLHVLLFVATVAAVVSLVVAPEHSLLAYGVIAAAEFAVPWVLEKLSKKLDDWHCRAVEALHSIDDRQLPAFSRS